MQSYWSRARHGAPRGPVEGLDVIITNVPKDAQVLQFLDTAWVTPGAFVRAVGVAHSSKCDTLRAPDWWREFAAMIGSSS
jgi:ornithine cyclodeaminase/alanine dehydrogenase-like protein (mu-crystallin family)